MHVRVAPPSSRSTTHDQWSKTMPTRLDTSTFLVYAGLAAIAVTACDSNTDDTASFSLTYERSDPDNPPNGKITHTFSGSSVDCKNDTSSPEGGPDRGDFYVGIVKDNGDGDALLLTVRFTELTSAPTPGTYTVGAGLRVTASFDSSAADAWSENYASGSVTVTGTAPAIRVTLDPSLAPLSGFMDCD